MTGKTEENTSANVPARMQFDPNDLRSIQTWEDATRLLAEQGVDLRDASTEIGDGFTLLDNKDELLNKPMLCIHWTFADGDFVNDQGEKTQFVVMRVLTQDGAKHVIIDGGTGICKQIRDYEARTGANGGLIVERGLRKSEYVNEYGAGVTYYLNV